MSTHNTQRTAIAEEWAQPSEEQETSPFAWVSRVAAHFQIPEPIEARDFPDRGNINQHTYLILAGPPGCQQEYLLQRINQEVFTQPRHVMAAMIAAIRAQRNYLARNPLPDDAEWETITLIPTLDGHDYLELVDEHGLSVWRMMVRIPDATTYKSLGEIADPVHRLRVAYEAGRGLALYGDLTSEVDTSALVSPLPGYRDTRVYYDQFRAVLQGCRTPEEASVFLPSDPVVRESTLHHFTVHLPEAEHQRRVQDPDLQPLIDLACRRAEFGLTLWHAMESGAIRTVAIHGDTKLDNFLFSTRTGRAKALVDLDTIMPLTWLADWGDMVRSLVNLAGEKEPDPSRVYVDMDVFRALAAGFLSTAREVTPAEVDLMVEAVQVIALELGVRFLTDYLRGDTYFRPCAGDPPHINKIRAMVQLTLFGHLCHQADAMRECIAALPKA